MTTAKQNIMIYRLGSLGDTVIALPCFNRIRECYPNANITLLTNKPVVSKAAPIEAILGKDYFFDQTLSYPVGTRNPITLNKLIRSIRKLCIDTVINITEPRSRAADIRDRLFFSAAGVSEFIGFDQSPEDYSVKIDPLTGEYEWEPFRLKRKMEKLGDFDLMEDRYWNMHLSQSELKKADTLLEKYAGDPNIISVNVGTKMEIKDWGIDNWIDLIGRLKKNLKHATFVIIGVKEEFELAERCLNEWNGQGLNLCGKCSPRVSAAILKQARIFIGHDSGPAHLAGCMGTPCVGIYSCINQPRQWFPKGENNAILIPDTSCLKSGNSECSQTNEKCIMTIRPEEVATAVFKTLNLVPAQ